MSLLIDGYNLLHASGVVPRGAGAGTLQRAREALLQFLVSAIDAEELRQTTIVFDAKEAPRGVPDVYDYQGMTIRFARHYREADVLLVELIRLDSAPRSLTVVSSDHQVQRAARRRRAKAVDSDVWCRGLMRQGRRLELPTEQPEKKPHAPLAESEVQRWMREFGEVDMSRMESEAMRRVKHDLDATDMQEHDDAPATDAPQSDKDASQEIDPLIDEAKRLAAEDRGLANPFPPGYAEDLLENEEEQ